jgi:hypothetical protein
MDGRDCLSFPAAISSQPDPRRPFKMQETLPRVKLRGGMESMHKVNFPLSAPAGIFLRL